MSWQQELADPQQPVSRSLTWLTGIQSADQPCGIPNSVNTVVCACPMMLIGTTAFMYSRLTDVCIDFQAAYRTPICACIQLHDKISRFVSIPPHNTTQDETKRFLTFSLNLREILKADEMKFKVLEWKFSAQPLANGCCWFYANFEFPKGM
ncbi:hypothetical protein Bbelb_381390 [Branchiostoma belcheri]|nr:hypothetical protein Bbelb_381390 [Branchiostoma belcheri]